MPNEGHVAITTAPPAPLSADDIMMVLTATPQADRQRLAAAVPMLAERLRAWEAAEDAAITELREQLGALAAEADSRRADTERLREEFAHLRRAVRARVLEAVDDGTLYNLRDEVDEALRGWGMPGLPIRYTVGLRVPFRLQVTASNPDEALSRAPTRLRIAAASTYGCEVHAYDADFNPPELSTGNPNKGDAPTRPRSTP